MRLQSKHRPLGGFTLIELLVVMGIILLMVTLAIVSVGTMLRSSRMSRAVGLIVAAMDEARTAAVTLRRSTKVDLTRMDLEGRLNRLSVVGPFFNDNFESYTPPSATNPDPTNGPNSLGWVTTDTNKPYVDSDGTRCMVMVNKNSYWNVLARVNTSNQDDFETNIQARVKFLRNSPRTGDRTISILAAVQDSGKTVSDAYRMNLKFSAADAASPGRNKKSEVSLDRISGGAGSPIGSAVDKMEIDANGAPSTTTDFVEGVWYRVSLSVKRVTDPNDAKKPYSIIAGKVWVDGQLEPWGWTVGPLKDTGPLANGTGGFATDGGNALVDDVLFDARPIRLLPDGLRVDAIDPTLAAPSQAVNDDSPYNFPILFRPDGTASFKYVIRITDATTGDKRYVAIDQNTGRARLEHKVEDALAK